MPHRNSKTVGILGAGTMGAGIAQVAAVAGWETWLLDVNAETARTAVEQVTKRLDRLVEKARLTESQRNSAVARLHPASSVSAFEQATLVVEAIVEDITVKSAALKDVLEVVDNQTIVATNTSSLSITRLGESIGRPQRTVGMHFFNPAPLLPLVEVIRGRQTSEAVVDEVVDIAKAWGKTAVRVRDTPGFIVNRVARPFYLESWRILEDGLASPDHIDRIMRDFGGFKMGPLELTDLIGQDVNAATTESVWQQLGNPDRLAPSRLQKQLVEEGRLGRKSSRGVYRYDDDEKAPDIEIDLKPLIASDDLVNAVEQFIDKATEHRGSDLEHYIFSRVLVAIINEAAWALADNVASPHDIDTAMKLGTNYPKGPVEWSKQIGRNRCTALLAALSETCEDHRFSVPDTLAASR